MVMNLEDAMVNLRRILSSAVNRSPRDNWKTALARFARLAPRSLPDLSDKLVARSLPDLSKKNVVLPEHWKTAQYCDLIASRVRRIDGALLLLGSPSETRLLQERLQAIGKNVTYLPWDWGQPVLPTPSSDTVSIVCKIPLTEAEWRSILELRRSSMRVLGIYELLLPCTLLDFAQKTLRYFVGTLEGITPLYLGESFFGPLDRLDELLPIRGLRVIEFGPGDATQTAGLVALGAAEITCIELRAENVLKTFAARELLAWNNVNVVMDDFHNVSSLNYGPYDLVVAHGVYYHSFAPFLFFENVLSLAGNIFFGGFYATDAVEAPYETLRHGDKEYRVKVYAEHTTSRGGGANTVGYLFTREDLIRVFRAAGREVTTISDAPRTSSTDPRGYIRILIRQS